ncbi:MAG: transcription termination factor Rho [Candidatus Celaenobacter antarcticus]|nr:transcription termination factor Rho [Candidatus Celaenobacter antarcticus]
MTSKTFQGLLNISGKQKPILWEIPFDKKREYYDFPYRFISQYKLVSGARITCEVNGRRIEKIVSICDMEPDEFSNRTPFAELVPTNPDEKFALGASEYDSLRIIDLMIPLGKGTRGLIVSPPRAGKTVLLEQMANSLIHIDHKVRVVILLIDERPEEVTSFKQNTNVQVFFSSFDQGLKSHVLLSNFLISHIKVELECGHDTVILLDSLTRMGRAYNSSERNPQSRTMSGGLGSSALELPRKLFGLARNIQGGGSCTILATILTNTGSRMDQMIFQEFKGTGNCEIIIDRDIADQRVYPAINILESGTRKEELLIPEEQLVKINELRKSLLRLDKVDAILKLKKLIEKTKNNEELLKNFGS